MFCCWCCIIFFGVDGAHQKQFRFLSSNNIYMLLRPFSEDSFVTSEVVANPTYQTALVMPIRLVMETSTFVSHLQATSWYFLVSINSELRPIPCDNVLETAIVMLTVLMDFSALSEMEVRVYLAASGADNPSLITATTLEVVSKDWHFLEI